MDINRLISYSLRTGVVASAALSIVGLAIWAATGYSQLNTAARSDVWTTVTSAITGSAAGIIYLAVAVLIATPVFRVALSTFFFAKQNDKKYVVITLAVFSMLIFALLSGAVG